ncbi:adenylate/guanylate cyclase domain-containing protein [uncultured Jatrophihabitans sp.]|uniref:adenylate/guanylate cyclase domain-containing protein n=1 Tax=uncultured Jatrophihabitans sp. TaxID=1610747 RepID=UPI0035CCA154
MAEDTQPPAGDPVLLGEGDAPALQELLDSAEDRLLGGSRDYTRLQIAERSGLPLDEVRRLWRALGFAVAADDEQAFTDADVEALRNVQALQAVGDIDEDLMRAMTRIIGQTFARLASWQGQLVLELVGRRPELIGDEGPEALTELMGELTPIVEGLHGYVWRRQLAAFFSRAASNAGASTGSTTRRGVGFVDMAGFTAFTRESSEAQLRDVLTAFESLASDVVSDHRGQIVKTIGDEILFVADTPADTASIALDLVERAADDDVLPSLRAGIAYGEVVSRLGDVFGQSVNIASRLTSVARPDSVLVDEGLHDELADDDGFVLRPIRPVAVRGYRHLRPWRLRRAGTD